MMCANVGKVAVVTGAGRGIGAAIAVALAGGGHSNQAMPMRAASRRTVSATGGVQCQSQSTIRRARPHRRAAATRTKLQVVAGVTVVKWAVTLVIGALAERRLRSDRRRGGAGMAVGARVALGEAALPDVAGLEFAIVGFALAPGESPPPCIGMVNCLLDPCLNKRAHCDPNTGQCSVQ